MDKLAEFFPPEGARELRKAACECKRLSGLARAGRLDEAYLLLVTKYPEKFRREFIAEFRQRLKAKTKGTTPAQ